MIDLSIMYTVSSLSSPFKRPLLICDDQCYSCVKFAKVVSTLSQGWIKRADHYYSTQYLSKLGNDLSADYDATKMLWLVNKRSAYGARSGLLPLIKEIIICFYRGRGKISDINTSCEFGNTDNSLSCYTLLDTLKRIIYTLSNGTT